MAKATKEEPKVVLREDLIEEETTSFGRVLKIVVDAKDRGVFETPEPTDVARQYLRKVDPRSGLPLSPRVFPIDQNGEEYTGAEGQKIAGFRGVYECRLT